MLIDYHMHTRLTDGVGEPVEYARVAMERGLDEIGISDHCPTPTFLAECNMKQSDLPAYVAMVSEARRQFPQLNVKLGLEVDFVPGCEPWVRELAGMYPWDYFLGSVHFIGDFPVDRCTEDWANTDVEQRWRQYFDLWGQAARAGVFDSLAHPDLPKKFGFRAKNFDYRPYLKDVTCAIEVSTAGLRKPCREIYPAEEFLTLARQFEIPITLGSDAHIPQDTGADFDKAVALARRCGYNQICRFTQRKRELVPLG
ncbi:MAG: Histidinol-phosphatase [Verrucomicrobiae bacterium]|nr:Histidinol-phosphatase [Verrucomicrobiae bacterium]